MTTELMNDIEPRRAAGLARLAAFVPSAGRAYRDRRNFDLGPDDRSNVSVLSPYVRHRLVLEEEIVAAVLAQHSFASAEKFLQEVCWRSYWKGWLEHRPGIWRSYLDEVGLERERVDRNAGLRHTRAAAKHGTTEIACFNAWVSELVTTGYLHNHARMWFASIWIHTLGLPWQLGADFFLRHLLDGDAASNTLSWRWVAGLHTPGKVYFARADNIAHYTHGRFPAVHGLKTDGVASPPVSLPASGKLRPVRPVPTRQPVTLLVTEEDLSPETLLADGSSVAAVLCLDTSTAIAGVSPSVATYKRAAMADCRDRLQRAFAVPPRLIRLSELAAALAAATGPVVTAEIPVGPTRDAVTATLAASASSIDRLVECRRPWDAMFWPHAKSGFFRLKERIPAVLKELGLSRD